MQIFFAVFEVVKFLPDMRWRRVIACMMAMVDGVVNVPMVNSPHKLVTNLQGKVSREQETHSNHNKLGGRISKL